jgi:hypothetical protein
MGNLIEIVNFTGINFAFAFKPKNINDIEKWQFVGNKIMTVQELEGMVLIAPLNNNPHCDLPLWFFDVMKEIDKGRSIQYAMRTHGNRKLFSDLIKTLAPYVKSEQAKTDLKLVSELVEIPVFKKILNRQNIALIDGKYVITYDIDSYLLSLQLQEQMEYDHPQANYPYTVHEFNSLYDAQDIQTVLYYQR